MKEIRYSPEDARKEADKIQEILGEKAGSQEYEIAHKLIEDEKSNKPANWLEGFNKGYLTIFPPSGDKHVMIGINTKDQNIFKLFNAAARDVTKQYRGFHQMGSEQPSGETAWELWDLPASVNPIEVVNAIYERMLKLEPRFRELGLLDEENIQ